METDPSAFRVIYGKAVGCVRQQLAAELCRYDPKRKTPSRLFPKSHTNEFVASKLGISRQSYEKKKKTGTFKLREITKLLTVYGTDFDYLFAEKSEFQTAV